MKPPIKLEVLQGTNEWFNQRQRRIGASESPIILCKQLDWGTPYSLWLEKIKPIGESKRDSADNWATKRGKYFEPKVRARYELFCDLDFPEGSFYRPETPHIMASLDGVNFEAKKIIEIKVPSKEVYQMAKDGQVHPKYVYQLEQQIYVMGGDDDEWSVDFVCGLVTKVDGKDELTDHVVVNYKSDPNKRKELLDAIEKFWNCVQTKTPPELTDKDSVTLKEDSIGELYAELEKLVVGYESLNDQASTYRKRIKELEKNIAGFITHPIVRIGKLEIIKRSRKGNVKYESIPELKGVDLDQYRGTTTEYLDIKVAE